MKKTIGIGLMAAAAFALAPLTAMAQAQKPAAPMPEGKGKVVVEAVCGACHATTLIQNSSGYTRDHWKILTSMMIDLSKQTDTQNEILDYLAANFPPNNNRAAKPMPGNFEIKFTEWIMPQLGQRSRDPVQHADGSIWYAGQFGNLIGRLDPVTGQAKEYTLPPNSLPHTASTTTLPLPSGIGATGFCACAIAASGANANAAAASVHARRLAVFVMAAWLAAILSGRLLAYTFRWLRVGIPGGF